MSAISDSRLLVMLSVSSRPKSLRRVSVETMLTPETVRKYARFLAEYGIAAMKSGNVSLALYDSLTRSFLQRYSRGVAGAILADASSHGIIRWNEDLQFVFSAPRGETVPDSVPTATTAMADYGLAFFSRDSFHHWAYWHPRLKAEDVAIHNILINPHSTRHISYALLLLAKAGFNQEYLLEEARSLGLKEGPEILAYLRGEEVGNKFFPPRSEFAELRAQYKVVL